MGEEVGPPQSACDESLDLPVLTAPVFPDRSAGGENVEDVTVPPGGSVDLPAGSYGDLFVGLEGTVSFLGGNYFIKSIDVAPGDPGMASFLFMAPSYVFVEGRIDSGKNSTIGPAAGTSIGTSDIIIFVKGPNAPGVNLNDQQPEAVDIGQNSDVDANFFSPNGTFHLRQNSSFTGAALAKNIKIDKEGTITLDSFFGEQPAVAFPDTVFVTGLTPLAITLAGLDPEEGTLIFKLVSAPLFGELTDSSTPTPVVLNTPGQVIPGVVPQCSDGVDNDNDTSTDFPADLDCTSANDNDESADPFANPEETGRAAESSTAATLLAIVTYTYTPTIPDPLSLKDPPGDSFSFLVEDVAGNTTTAVVTIRSQNDAQGISGTPVANIIMATTIKENDLAIELSGAPAEDPGSNEVLTPVTYSVESLPTLGTLKDGATTITAVPTDLSGTTVVYSPTDQNTGSDKFDFKVRLATELPPSPGCSPNTFDDPTCNTVFIEIQDTLRFQFTTELSQPIHITLSSTGGAATGAGTGEPLSLGPVELVDDPGWTTDTAFDLIEERSGHQSVAVTLFDGTNAVLSIGGDSVGLGGTVDVYDQDNNASLGTIPMVSEHGTGFTATTLQDGRVLVVGGTGPLGPDGQESPPGRRNLPSRQCGWCCRVRQPLG